MKLRITNVSDRRLLIVGATSTPPGEHLDMESESFRKLPYLKRWKEAGMITVEPASAKPSAEEKSGAAPQVNPAPPGEDEDHEYHAMFDLALDLGFDLESGIPRDELEKRIVENAGESLKKDELKRIADVLDIRYDSGDTKADLIRKISEGARD